jgi:hypothetical protein
MMPKVNMVTSRYVLIWSLVNHIVVVNSFCGDLYPKQRQKNGAPLRNSLLNPRHRGTQLIVHATSSDDGKYFCFDSTLHFCQVLSYL